MPISASLSSGLAAISDGTGVLGRRPIDSDGSDPQPASSSGQPAHASAIAAVLVVILFIALPSDTWSADSNGAGPSHHPAQSRNGIATAWSTEPSLSLAITAIPD